MAQHGEILENIVTIDVLLEPRLCPVAAKRGSRLVPALLLLSWCFPTVAQCSGPEILGLQLGTSQSAVRELFDKSHISLSQIDAQHLSAPNPLVPLEGAREVRLAFDNDTLRKITVLFEIPPYQSTAANLIQLYEREKERLKQRLGAPTSDTVDMRAPAPQDRYQWLVRGQGYYLSSWTVNGQMKVTLWLYGEDDGIVLMEMYESLEK
jgi:hypothetical protein